MNQKVKMRRSKKFGQAEYRKRMRETESERCEAKAKMLKVMESASRANITPENFSHVYNDILVKEGKITENEQNMVMYKSKAVRLQKKLRENLIEDKKGRKVVGVMFDERKDECLGEVSNVKERVENCSVVIFPGKDKVPNMETGSNVEVEICQVGNNPETHGPVDDEFLGAFKDAEKVKKKREDAGEYLGHFQPKGTIFIKLSSIMQK